jgi:hypothetical protein
MTGVEGQATAKRQALPSLRVAEPSRTELALGPASGYVVAKALM